MPQLSFFRGSALLLKHPHQNAEVYCEFEVKCVVNMSFLKEVSGKASFLSFEAPFLKDIEFQIK